MRGNVGIAAIHLESGTRLSLNGDRAFPMASVSKIPMALEFLRRVVEQEVRRPRDLSRSGPGVDR